MGVKEALAETKMHHHALPSAVAATTESSLLKTVINTHLLMKRHLDGGLYI